MKLYIKYMVSLRCKMMVKAELKQLGLHYGTVELGEVEVIENITSKQSRKLKLALLKSGLELMEDKNEIFIERIKNVIIEMIHYEDEYPLVKHSVYISEKLQQDYSKITSSFSEATGFTIEHYIIANKIEKVKELLLYDELSLKEISYKLNYSSVAHLSAQFKKNTGLTPTYFKRLKIHKIRIALENIK